MRKVTTEEYHRHVATMERMQDQLDDLIEFAWPLRRLGFDFLSGEEAVLRETKAHSRRIVDAYLEQRASKA